jgi:hypothetical protein
MTQYMKQHLNYYPLVVKHASQATLPRPRWKPPEGDVRKINTDRCFDPNLRSGGWGFVVRDSNGEAMGAVGCKLTHVVDAFQAKADACSHALIANML